MSTIITRNSANSGSVPSSLVQGELAINVTDNRLFFGSGSGNTVKEFGVTSSYALNALSASYAGTASYAPDYLPLTGGTISGNLYQLGTFYPDQIDWFSSSIGYNTGSYILTTTINGLTTYANYQDVANTLAPYIPTVSSSISASYAGTASYAPAYLPLTGGTINGDVIVNGTASIAFLNVTYESASVIYSSGSNQFGDALNDTQTLWGTVDIKTGPVLVTGSLNVSGGITGSLFGTASYSTTALSSSFASTASYVQNAQTASYVLQAVSASFASTASYVVTAQTASFVTASNVYGPFGSNSVISASYATTSSVSLAATANIILVLNQSGNTIAKGTVVHITASGNSSDIPRVITASYENDNNSANTLGISSEAITNGSTGFVTTEGVLTGINTSAFTSGQLVYLGATGSIIGTAPLAPLHGVRLGQVIRDQAVNGSIYVRVDNGYELGELHDVLITSASTGDLISWNSSSGVWTNSKQLSGSYGLTGSLTATSFTGSLLGTATTASYVLNAVSASFASTASYATNALSSSFASTASYVQTAQTASYVLQAVSASYATQALSASYAPSTPAFPYTGSAIITGSLGITGSFTVQTYDSIIANAFVDAIRISDTSRIIYDTFGTESVNAAGRRLYDSTGVASIAWQNRVGIDSTGAQSIDWETRVLYDPTNVSQSIDWANRATIDSFGVSSIGWDGRALIDSNGSTAVNWDVITNNYKVETFTYLKRFIESGIQESFSDVPTVAFNYEGEVIQATLDVTVSQFDLVYLETDGKWYPVTQATADCSKLLGICAEAGGRPKVILEGSITVNDGTYTDTPQVQFPDHGLPIYIRESAGNTMSTNVPALAGQYVRILGHAYYQNTVASNYWIMKFRPSNEWYVI